MVAGLIWLDVVAAVFGIVLVKKFFTKRSSALPPGPSKLPILENLLDMPTSHEWITFAEWGKKWGMELSCRISPSLQLPIDFSVGPMTTVSVFGQPIIVVNSSKTAVDLMDKKSAIYSDRPVMPMGGELVGWKDTLVLVPYGDRFRNYRKFFHQVIGSNSSVSLYYPTEELETHRFLKSVLKAPDDLVAHIRQ